MSGLLFQWKRCDFWAPYDKTLIPPRKYYTRDVYVKGMARITITGVL
jgi:hypothetical protein